MSRPASAQPSAAELRALGAGVIAEVVTRGRYLDRALAQALMGRPAAIAKSALLQEMTYGTLRWFDQLAGIAAFLLARPLARRDADIHALLLLGLYQLRHMRLPDYAAVDATVEAAGALHKPWAKTLLNACLRAYLRDPDGAQAVVERAPALAWSHPAWLLERVRAAYPRDWRDILAANNQRPPLTLRVNLARTTRPDYLERLRAAGIAAQPLGAAATAVLLDEPLDVTALPGFADGDVSVQDAAAQLAAPWLQGEEGARVLDACAAPGGKTAHLLEHRPAPAELVAVDSDASRLTRLHGNLQRLGLSAQVILGDAGNPAAWWDGRAFDRILLDAPCSATGVIRRHPDIKRRRRPSHLPTLRAAQTRLLEALWPLLKPGGKLLYVTCSILPEENERQIAAFRGTHADAHLDPLPAGPGSARGPARQILPGEERMDGFFYARLAKH